MSTSLASSLAAQLTRARIHAGERDVKIAASAHRTNQLNFRCGRRALIKAKKAPPRYQRKARRMQRRVEHRRLSFCTYFIMHIYTQN